MRKVIIHIGMPKTGTTYIQNTLGRTNIIENIYSYKTKKNNNYDNATAGNGFELYTFIKRGDINEASKIIKTHFNDKLTPIISSEALWSCDEVMWKNLLESLSNIGATADFIVFIRDALPWCISLYDQGIKRHGVYKSFKEWYSEIDSIYGSLITLARIVPMDSIRAVHYEEGEKKLLTKFFKALKESKEFINSFEEDSQINNRSLTNLERHIMKEVNKRTGDIISTKISDALLRNRDLLSEKISVSESTKQEFIDRYQHEVDLVNKVIFGNKKTIKVFPDLNSEQIPKSPVQKHKRCIDDLNTKKTYETVIFTIAEIIANQTKYSKEQKLKKRSKKLFLLWRQLLLINQSILKKIAIK